MFLLVVSLAALTFDFGGDLEATEGGPTFRATTTGVGARHYTTPT